MKESEEEPKPKKKEKGKRKRESKQTVSELIQKNSYLKNLSLA